MADSYMVQYWIHFKLLIQPKWLNWHLLSQIDCPCEFQQFPKMSQFLANSWNQVLTNRPMLNILEEKLCLTKLTWPARTPGQQKVCDTLLLFLGSVPSLCGYCNHLWFKCSGNSFDLIWLVCWIVVSVSHITLRKSRAEKLTEGQ